jgi:uncharacterized membrane protein YuzA (DUF378 family)
MHSLMKTVRKVCGIINSICAIHVGLMSVGYDVFSYPMIADRIGWAMTYINYGFGFSGIAFLVLSVIHFSSQGSCCSSQGCGSCGVMGKN